MPRQIIHLQGLTTYCPCGGVVKNDVELYVSQEEKLVVQGICSKCLEKVISSISIDDLYIMAKEQQEPTSKSTLN
jgi:acetylglutamate synthase